MERVGAAGGGDDERLEDPLKLERSIEREVDPLELEVPDRLPEELRSILELPRPVVVPRIDPEEPEEPAESVDPLRR
ncbi:MAG TPA: hypothetical protein PLU25_00745 [Acidobacteriota bacterium]|nr:hypothetical protein [Acidobacteriota bacterium]